MMDCKTVGRAAALNASELPKLTPRIMHGPLIGVTMVTRDDLGQYHAQLSNGAGYEIGLSFVDAETFSWFAIGLPQVMSADSETDSFRYSLGLSMKLMGNFGVGAIYDLIKPERGPIAASLRATPIRRTSPSSSPSPFPSVAEVSLMRIGKKKERDHPKWMYSRWVDIVPFGGHALRLTYDERNNLLSVGGAYLDYVRGTRRRCSRD